MFNTEINLTTESPSECDEPTPDPRCPYCNSDSACKHLLLSIDQDELGDASGDLADIFHEKVEEAQSELAHHIARALLAAAERLAGTTTGSPINDRPGVTWNYRNLYVRDSAAMRAAIKQFQSLKVRITIDIE
jgi:hypothetical protein